MKTLKDLIQEKLHINKNIKPTIELDIKGKTVFTQEEIDEIYDFGCSLKINPIIITNQYVHTIKGFVIDKDVIFMHFYDEWKEIAPYIKATDIKNEEEQIIAIRFEKNINTHKYYYNWLYNTRGWLCSTRDGEQSCEKAISCLKNALN